MKFICALLFVLAPTAANATSFNCDNHHLNHVERLVCSERELSALDDSLNLSYHRALIENNDPDQIKKYQRNWLSSLANCHDVICVNDQYLLHIRSLRSDVDCNNSQNDFEKMVCVAHDENELKSIYMTKMSDLDFVADKMNFFPNNTETAKQQWHSQLDSGFRYITEHCLSFRCKQAKIVVALQENSFPNEVYRRFREWVEKEGDQSLLLTSNRWSLPAGEVEALWGIIEGRIFWIGDKPEWLRVEHWITKPHALFVSAPEVQPPFLDRKLTFDEAESLRRFVSEYSFLNDENAKLAGINQDIWKSARFDDASGPKCSPNPLYSDVHIDHTFPFPIADDKAFKISDYKLIEIRSSPSVFRVPICSYDEAYPDGFFPKGALSYRSRVFIDDISGQPVVRPDGTFWLKLSDGNWYRFRRDMTTDAPEIGKKYHVIVQNKFNEILDESNNIKELDAKLISLFER